MDNAKFVKLDRYWQRPEPVDGIAQLATRQLIQRCLMLFLILLITSPETFPTVRATCVKRDGVEFVVSHDRVSVSVLDGCSRNLDGFSYLGASVDEVTDEYDLSLLVLIPVSAAPVAEPGEQMSQLLGVSVDVADDVVVSHDLFFLFTEFRY